MGRGGLRGRGPDAGVLVDQGVHAPLQRGLPRQQVLPVPGDLGLRGVPEGVGHAAGAPPRDPLPGAVHEGLGDPRHPRPTPDRLPHAILRQDAVQPVAANGPALPVRAHRTLRGAVRGADRRGRAPRHRRRAHPVHGGRQRPGHRRAEEGDGPGRRERGVRDRRPVPRRDRCPGGRQRTQRRGLLRGPRRRRLRRGLRRARGLRPGVLRAGRPHQGPAGLDLRRDRRAGRGRDRLLPPPPGLRLGAARRPGRGRAASTTAPTRLWGRSPRRSGFRPCPGTASSWRPGWRSGAGGPCA